MHRHTARHVTTSTLIPFILLCLIASILVWTPVQASGPADNSEKGKGIVEEMPGRIWFGTWVIDGEEYTATVFTQFRQKEGPLTEEACVKFEYKTDSTPYRLTKIETQDADKCMTDDEGGDNGEGDNGEGDNDGDGGDNGNTATMPETKAYGRIGTLPETEDLTGVWIISEMEYVVTGDTDLDRDHGDFEENACVEVKYTMTSETRIATKIETEQAYKCDKDENQRPHGILFGTIFGFPEGLIGEWNIGDKTIIADENTDFKEKRNVKFNEGVVVKVHFVEQVDGTLLATKIQAKFRVPWFDGGDDDDDENDEQPNEGLRGHAFGQIESYPEDLIGEWAVSGITFTATAQTSYIQRTEAFTVGASVRVNYTVDVNGERIASLIKTTARRGNNEHKFCGFVNVRPAAGFLGRWGIDSFFGSTDRSTKFDESLSLLGEQAYVEVDYTVAEDGTITYQKIKAHVPPGAGENDSAGPISRIDNSVQAASIDADESWTINGVTYTVTPATELDESQGAIEVGTMVSVNSYTAEDGTEVATQIRTVNITPAIFLPISQW